MFDNRDYDTLMDEVLERVDDKFDKREGSLLYTMAGPVIMELVQLYADLDSMFDQTYARTADREYLIERCRDGGIKPIEGTPAKIRITVTPADVNLGIYPVFQIGDQKYIIRDNPISSGVYLMTASENGTAGNKSSGPILPVNTFIDGETVTTIPGLQKVEFTALEEFGTDDETTESLLQRYLETFDSDERTGNMDWYRKTITAFDDVYACRVQALTYKHYNQQTQSYETITDGRTIVAYIVGKTADGQAMQTGETATQEEIDAVVNGVRDALDSKQPEYGEGRDKLPFGQTLRVYDSGERMTTVTATVELENTWQLSEVEDRVKNTILDYFKTDLMDKWGNTDSLAYVAKGRGELITKLVALAGIKSADISFSFGAGYPYQHAVTNAEHVSVVLKE